MPHALRRRVLATGSSGKVPDSLGATQTCLTSPRHWVPVEHTVNGQDFPFKVTLGPTPPVHISEAELPRNCVFFSLEDGFLHTHLKTPMPVFYYWPAFPHPVNPGVKPTSLELNKRGREIQVFIFEGTEDETGFILKFCTI